MELSIIIVNWNSKEYLRNCIGSILATTGGIEFEIVVIDNGSFDGSDQMLRQYYPDVRFIQSKNNIGFAKANNAAFLESNGQYVLFLNPDTEVVGNAVNFMFDNLQRQPNAGAVNCKLLNADRTIQTSCIQSFPTILNQLLDIECLRRLAPKSGLWGMAHLYHAGDEPGEVEALSGACIMLKRTIFKQVGMFSEDYFMYSEDIDLCYKIRQAGYKNYYIPNAAVVHYGCGSTEKTASAFSAVAMCESRWRYLKKNRGYPYSIAYRVVMLMSAIGRIALLLTVMPLGVARRNRASWIATIRKWWAKLAWSLWCEKRF